MATGRQTMLRVANYRKRVEGGVIMHTPFNNLLTLQPVHDSNGLYQFTIGIQCDEASMQVPTHMHAGGSLNLTTDVYTSDVFTSDVFTSDVHTLRPTPSPHCIGTYAYIHSGRRLRLTASASSPPPRCASGSTYLHTYMHTYIPTCIPTYLHAYVRTHIHACNVCVRAP